ncbi:MAG: hypothetical protein JKY50_13270 [Oleispira sp.]|nr:hypothetical protein [Oleispira sp.]MBL4880380.1 hypothetical protein [Oleispira sp.]
MRLFLSVALIVSSTVAFSKPDETLICKSIVDGKEVFSQDYILNKEDERVDILKSDKIQSGSLVEEEYFYKFIFYTDTKITSDLATIEVTVNRITGKFVRVVKYAVNRSNKNIEGVCEVKAYKQKF